MYELDIELARAIPQADLGRMTRQRSTLSLFQCLIFSPSEQRARSWEHAARSSGWDPVVCDHPDLATRHATRNRLLLSVIDVEALPKPTIPLAKRLCESLVGQQARDQQGQRTLVIVCGNEEDPIEEIWARGLGVWLYLPGVDASCNLALLCDEARSLVAKRQQTRTGQKANVS